MYIYTMSFALFRESFKLIREKYIFCPTKVSPIRFRSKRYIFKLNNKELPWKQSHNNDEDQDAARRCHDKI